jgi:CO dehydrogenase/acetyl-CoA synthase delta subunit
MKKSLIYTIAICAIYTVAIIPADYVSANNHNGNFLHVDGNSQFPQKRWSIVRHTLKVHIPKNSQRMAQISIAVPETVNWSNKINDVVVSGNKGAKNNTKISINGQNIILAFDEPLPPDSHVEIDIKNIRQPFFGNGPIYRLFAKAVGSNVDISIGIARFRIY